MKKEKKERLHRELQAVEETYAGTLNWLEQGELRSWVEAGNSPLRNPEQMVHGDGRPLGFIEWHRKARWVTETVSLHPPSDRELFNFYTDRRTNHGTLEDTRKFLWDAQTFLGCEILTLVDFLREQGLWNAYLRYKYPASFRKGESPF